MKFFLLSIGCYLHVIVSFTLTLSRDNNVATKVYEIVFEFLKRIKIKKRLSLRPV